MPLWVIMCRKKCKNRQHVNTFQTHFILHAAVKVKKTQQSEMLTIITPLSLLHSKDLIQLPWNISVLGPFGYLITVCGLHYLCEIASSRVQKVDRQIGIGEALAMNKTSEWLDFMVFMTCIYGFLKSWVKPVQWRTYNMTEEMEQIIFLSCGSQSNDSINASSVFLITSYYSF